MTDTSAAPVQPSILPDPGVDGAYYVESSTAAYYHVDNEYVLQHPATVPADAHVFTLTNGAWAETSPGASPTQPAQDTSNAGQLDSTTAAPQASQDSSAVQAPDVPAQPVQEAPVTTDAAPTTPAPADTAAQPVPAQDSTAAPAVDQSATTAAPADTSAPQTAAPAAVVDTATVTTPAPDAPTAGAPTDTSSPVAQDASAQPAPADQSAAPAPDASAAAAPVAPATPDAAQAPATPADAAVAAPVAAPATAPAPADVAPAVAAPAADAQSAPSVQTDAAVAAPVAPAAPQADVQAAAPVEAPKSEEEQYLDDIKANGTDEQKKVLAAIETFADRLQPHKPILASDGAKHQHEFLKWLLWALEKDYEAFRGAWNVLLVYMQVHHGYNTASKFSALSEFSTNRFLFAWTKGEEHCRAYTSLMTLLRATRNRETRQHDIKTIRLESVAPGVISEKALNNLKAFYQV